MPPYISCWLFSRGNLFFYRVQLFLLHNIPHYWMTKECEKIKITNDKWAALWGHFGLMNWQQGNVQSLNTEQVHGLKNTMPFVSGRLTHYLLCGAGKSPSNSALMGLRGKPSSQIKLGSNVWTSYSNSDHLAEKKIYQPATRAVTERDERRATGGCQLRKKEGHHPLREEQQVCLPLPRIH